MLGLSPAMSIYRLKCITCINADSERLGPSFLALFILKCVVGCTRGDDERLGLCDSNVQIDSEEMMEGLV